MKLSKQYGQYGLSEDPDDWFENLWSWYYTKTLHKKAKNTGSHDSVNYAQVIPVESSAPAQAESEDREIFLGMY